MSKLDIVLFGATGYTGSYCIESIYKLTKTNGRTFTWGVAGRSEQKLKDALREFGNETGEDLSSIPIIIADVKDYASIVKMTAKAKVIINLCGPYRFYGEQVVKACVETGTHHVDVSGEPQYMETMQDKYFKAAQEKGIYIVSACGFDSIPADLGAIFLQEKFEGTLNSVETYLKFEGDGQSKGANFATYESAVYGVGAAKELGRLRRKLYPTPLPKFRPKLNARPAVHKSDVINKWCIPFIGSDRSVVQRTQRYLFDNKIARPLQIHTYVGFDFVTIIFIIILGTIFSFLAKFKFGRYLLLKYPSVFTAGYIQTERLNKSNRSNTRFSITLRGEGWSEKASEPSDEFQTEPNKKMAVRVGGSDPGYGLTSTLVTLAAVVILLEEDKLPKGGGVYTPGIAFRSTSYIKLAQENGLKFEIL